MDAKTKIALSIILGVVGIGCATVVLGTGGNSFWIEFSKWAPSVLVSIFALWSADKAHGEAKEATREAGEGKAAAERSEANGVAAKEAGERAEKLAAIPDKDKRKALKGKDGRNARKAHRDTVKGVVTGTA